MSADLYRQANGADAPVAHTPGEWQFLEEGETESRSNAGQPLTIWSETGGDLANIYSEDDARVKVSREQAIANARLIAAAPSLLAALKAALAVIADYVEYEHNGDPWTEDARTMGEMDINDYQSDGRLDAARAAIAKATGSAS